MYLQFLIEKVYIEDKIKNIILHNIEGASDSGGNLMNCNLHKEQNNCDHIELGCWGDWPPQWKLPLRHFVT